MMNRWCCARYFLVLTCDETFLIKLWGDLEINLKIYSRGKLKDTFLQNNREAYYHTEKIDEIEQI